MVPLIRSLHVEQSGGWVAGILKSSHNLRLVCIIKGLSIAIVIIIDLLSIIIISIDLVDHHYHRTYHHHLLIISIKKALAIKTNFQCTFIKI